MAARVVKVLDCGCHGRISFSALQLIDLSRQTVSLKADTEGAEDGHKGLQLFDRVRPDLVLLDVTLPDQSGIEICQQMH